MSAELPYNSALKSSRRDGARNLFKQTSFYQNERGVIFHHDLCTPLSLQKRTCYAQAKCVVSDLAWPAGFKRFADRAGVEQCGPHSRYIAAVRELVDTLAVPTFLTCSQRDARALSAQLITTIELNGQNVPLARFHEEQDYAPRSQEMDSLCLELAARYDSVLDFSCGYGNTLRAFRYFIGSDIDKHCLYYIQKEIMQCR